MEPRFGSTKIGYREAEIWQGLSENEANIFSPSAVVISIGKMNDEPVDFGLPHFQTNPNHRISDVEVENQWNGVPHI